MKLGTVDVTALKVGTVNASKAYLGSTLVWEAGGDPGAGIEFIGSSTGTTSATLPAHQAGDLIVAWAYRSSSSTVPTLPTGWTNLDGSGNSTNASRIAYLIAEDDSTTSGTWTAATVTIFAVYRGATVGAFANSGDVADPIPIPSLTLDVTNGSSHVLSFVGTPFTVDLSAPPSGLVTRESPQRSAAYETDGGVSAWAGSSKEIGSLSRCRAAAIELKAS